MICIQSGNDAVSWPVPHPPSLSLSLPCCHSPILLPLLLLLLGMKLTRCHLRRCHGHLDTALRTVTRRGRSPLSDFVHVLSHAGWQSRLADRQTSLPTNRVNRQSADESLRACVRACVLFVLCVCVVAVQSCLFAVAPTRCPPAFHLLLTLHLTTCP